MSLEHLDSKLDRLLVITSHTDSRLQRLEQQLDGKADKIVVRAIDGSVRDAEKNIVEIQTSMRVIRWVFGALASATAAVVAAASYLGLIPAK